MKKLGHGTGIGLTLAMLFSLLWYPVKASADQVQDYVTTHMPSNNEAIVTFFHQFDAIIAHTGFWAFVGRSISWWLIDLLVKLVNVLTGVYGEIVSLIPFYESDGVANLLSQFTVLQKAFATLVIVSLGTMMVFIGRKANVGETLVNLVCVFLILGFLTFGMSKATSIVTAYVSSGTNETTPSGQLEVGESNQTNGFAPGNTTVLANVSDVYAFAVDDFEHPDLEKKNFITDYKTINPLEIVDMEMIKNYSPEKGAYLEKKLQSIPGTDGTVQEVAVDINDLPKLLKPLTPLIGDSYYRYVYNAWTIIITLAITALVLVLTSYKGAGLIIDIAWNYLFVNIIGFLDIRTLSRFKKVVESIFTSIAMFLIIPALISLFGLFNAFIAASGISLVAQIICLAAGGYFVINGPEQVVRVLGIDAGVKDGWNLIGGALGLSKAGKAAIGGVAGAASSAAGIGGFIAGYTANAGGEGSSDGEGLYDQDDEHTEDDHDGSLYGDEQETNDTAHSSQGQGAQEGLEQPQKDEENASSPSSESSEGGHTSEGNEESSIERAEEDPDSLSETGAKESTDPVKSQTKADSSASPTSSPTRKSKSATSTTKEKAGRPGKTEKKPTVDQSHSQPSPSVQEWAKNKATQNRFAQSAKKGYEMGKGTQQKQRDRQARKQQAKRPLDED
ncbi:MULTISPECIES: pLS20_p028 family conjugation system transmembrane protein [Listeria]|uniref:pLS20_p028 family conjugation system transmembrane protein n=1 Tax=Listeria TaxID=1637 RepID=UPI000B58ADF2|nr:MULTISPECIES: phage holin family protein [Listeria]